MSEVSGSLSVMDSEAFKKPHLCYLFIDMHSVCSHVFISQAQKGVLHEDVTVFVICNLLGQVFKGVKKTCQSTT